MKNKGITLVEIMLSLAILGIVILGVGAMMRSGSTLFLKGSNESNLQTEAQIAMNQIETILLNADVKVTSGGAYDYFEAFQGNDTTSRYVDFVSADHKLNYSYVQNSTIICDNVLLAENVDDFKVDMSKYSTDNIVSVTLKMKNRDAEYECSKEIFLRNPVGKPITAAALPAALGGGGTSYAYELTVCRYGKYNLREMYNFEVANAATAITTGATDYLCTVDPATGAASVELQAGFVGDAGRFARTASGVIEGTINGVAAKIKLTTEAVEFHAGTPTEPNYFVLDTDSASALHDSFVHVTGICLDNVLPVNESDAASYPQTNCRPYYTASIYYNTTSGTRVNSGDSFVASATKLSKDFKVSAGGGKQASFKDGSQLGHVNLNICGDVKSDNLAIQQTSANNFTAVGNDWDTAVSNGRAFIEIKVNFYKDAAGNKYYTGGDKVITLQIKKLK